MTHTCAKHSCILVVVAVVLSPVARRTVHHSVLSSSTVEIIQPDSPHTIGESGVQSPYRGRCTCWKKKGGGARRSIWIIAQKRYVRKKFIQLFPPLYEYVKKINNTQFLTGVLQLPANHSGLVGAKKIVTDGTPFVFMANFYSSSICSPSTLNPK